MDIFIVFALLILIAAAQINGWQAKDLTLPHGYLWILFSVHFALSFVYLSYTYFNRSDSQNYFLVTKDTDDWMSLWGTGTPFIHFITWPFTHYIGLGYIATMLIFAYMGFLGSAFFYLSTRGQIVALPPAYGKYTWAELVFLLPNIHFWSASIGKGSVMFLAIGLYIYGLSRFNSRPFLILIGLLLAYMVRPHIAFVMMAGTAIGLFITGKGIPWYVKLLVGGAAVGASILLFQESVEFTQVDQGNLEAFLQHRTDELGKSGSGVDIGSYNIFMKLFTFWFRPLFIDAPGALGLFVSFENAFYVFMLYQIFSLGWRSWGDWNGWYKSCVFIFLLGSVILAQVSGNLGIAMRQKAQLMPLFFFLFLKVKEYEYRKQFAKMPGSPVIARQ